MIFIKAYQLENTRKFGERFHHLLSMIPNGKSWLDWALKNVANDIMVSNENQLLSVVIYALQDEDYIRFPNFRISLEKMFTLPDADIKHLADLYHAKPVDKKTIQHILKANSIVTYAEMESALQVLQSGAPGSKAIFELPSVSDLVYASVFVNYYKTVSEEIKSAAYDFAADKAVTLNGFLDLASFYIYVANEAVNKNLTPKQLTADVNVKYQLLSEGLFNWLFTSSVGPGKSKEELAEAVRQFAGTPAPLGYATSTSALLNLVKNINFEKVEESGLKSQVKTYNEFLKTLLGTIDLKGYSVSQDGKQTTFKYANEKGVRIMIGASNDGNLFILPGTEINNNLI